MTFRAAHEASRSLRLPRSWASVDLGSDKTLKCIWLLLLFLALSLSLSLSLSCESVWVRLSAQKSLIQARKDSEKEMSAVVVRCRQMQARHGEVRVSGLSPCLAVCSRALPICLAIPSDKCLQGIRKALFSQCRHNPGPGQSKDGSATQWAAACILLCKVCTVQGASGVSADM